MENSRRITGLKNSHGDDMNASQSVVNESIWDVLGRVYGERKHAKEMLARAAMVTPGASQNWLRRRCVPQAEQLITLMASCDELAAEINRLVEERKRRE